MSEEKKPSGLRARASVNSTRPSEEKEMRHHNKNQRLYSVMKSVYYVALWINL